MGSNQSKRNDYYYRVRKKLALRFLLWSPLFIILSYHMIYFEIQVLSLLFIIINTLYYEKYFILSMRNDNRNKVIEFLEFENRKVFTVPIADLKVKYGTGGGGSVLVGYLSIYNKDKRILIQEEGSFWTKEKLKELEQDNLRV